MFLRQNTAVDVLIGPFVDKTDGNTVEADKTLDVELSKNGQALVNKSDATAPNYDDGANVRGYYNCELDATDTNTVGTLKLVVHHADALPVWHNFQVVEEAVYDALFASGATGAFTGVSVNALTSAAITDVWSQDPLVESYAANGSQGTAAQLLYMIWSCINDFSISSTTITSKKLNGDTSALEWRIDDASSPTSRSRNNNPS